MTVTDARLVGLVTIEIEPDFWRQKNSKGEWVTTEKKAVITRRKSGRSIHEVKWDIEEVTALISMLQNVEI